MPSITCVDQSPLFPTPGTPGTCPVIMDDTGLACGRDLYGRPAADAEAVCNGHWERARKGTSMGTSFRVMTKREGTYLTGTAEPGFCNVVMDDQTVCMRPHAGRDTICSMHRKRLRDGRPMGATPRQYRRGYRGFVATDRDEFGNKACFRCGEWVKEEHFTPQARSPDGLTRWCTRCTADSNHNLSVEDRWLRLEQQEWRCYNLGCRNILTLYGPDTYNVDHHHDHCDKCDNKSSCGESIRSLLCRTCNLTFGYCKEDPNRLWGLQVYALEHQDILRDQRCQTFFESAQHDKDARLSA